MQRTLKERRHSGRVTPRFAIKGKYSELIENCLEPQEFWDDWEDYRDGMRNPTDKKHIRKIPEHSFLGKFFNVRRWNKKLKMLVQRRKAVKVKKGEVEIDF